VVGTGQHPALASSLGQHWLQVGSMGLAAGGAIHCGAGGQRGSMGRAKKLAELKIILGTVPS